MPATPVSTAELLDFIRKSGICNAQRLSALPPAEQLPPEPAKAAKVLVENGTLTAFQAGLLLQGRFRGFRAGSYVILNQLGRGGMGAVYLAEHEELRRKVAIKVLVPGKDTDAKLAQDRFLREARAAAALDHPNIVRIHDVARHGDAPYLVMEYVEGLTLQQILDRDGAMPYPAAVDCVLQAAAGLQHAYEKGFVHRDIKPANLMRDNSGTIKVLDMGLARSCDKAEDKLTEVMDKGAIVGTADFIAPEQAMNTPPIDIRADIYSLGATFFALVAGRPPFEGNTTQKLLQHQLKAPPTLTAVGTPLPKGLAEVVARMLAKKPDQRFATPADVIEAISPWLSTEGSYAGNSRTRLAHGLGVLNDAARSGRFIKPSDSAVAMNEAVVVDMNDQGLNDTLEGIQSVRTTRTSFSKVARPVASESAAAPPRAKRRGRGKPIAIGALLCILAGGAAAFLFNNGGSEPAQASQAEGVVAALAPEIKPPPGARPKSEPAKTAVPVPPLAPAERALAPAPRGPIVLRYDAAQCEPFHVKLRGDSVLEGATPALPPGVSLTGGKTSEAEFTRLVYDGRPALMLVPLSMPLNAVLALDLERTAGGAPLAVGALYKARVLYRAEGAGRMHLVFQTEKGKPLHSGPYGSPTKGEWKWVETECRRGGDPIRIAVESRILGAENAVYVARVEVLEAAPPRPVPAEGGEVVLALAGNKMKEFSQLYEMSAEAKYKQSKLVSTSGEGRAPMGWQTRAMMPGCQVEFAYDDDTGSFCLKNIGGPGGAQLAGPVFVCPSGAFRLRLDYKSGATAGLMKILFRPLEGAVREVAVPEPTAGIAWAALDVYCNLKGATAGTLELVNTDSRPEGAFHFRGLTAAEIPVSSVPVPVEVQKIYALDLAGIPEFRVRKLGGNRIEGAPEMLPKGMKAACNRQVSVGEFTRERRDGAPVLGLGVVNAEPPALFAFNLEDEMGIALTPKTDYRIKIQYQSVKDGNGMLTLQVPNPPTMGNRYRSIDSDVLSAAANDWKTAFLDFTRVEGLPVRFAIEARSTSPGSMIYIRSVEVFELKKP